MTRKARESVVQVRAARLKKKKAAIPSMMGSHISAMLGDSAKADTVAKALLGEAETPVLVLARPSCPNAPGSGFP